MKNTIKTVYGGVNSKVGDLLVNRLIPARKIESVGPIVFLDHVYPKEVNEDANSLPTGVFAHPHRGIATFSYVFSGNLSHYDSRGNHSIIGAGGVQWMKAGNGIIHDEMPFTQKASGNIFHSLQFWINLPSDIKKEEPEYQAVQAHDVPEISLPDNAGVLRVLLGEFGTVQSPIKTFRKEFIYHIRLNPKSRFSFNGKTTLEYGAFVPTKEVSINDVQIGKSKIAIFETNQIELVFENPDVEPVDVLVFGGEPYLEPVIGEGPFVMNSHSEIAEAYKDFFDGRYGEINYAIKG
ncbi:MAG TPA: pirin family protein [Chitinophagaceae bacterium]|nr:pirin family protein [Chitinophagaceae bacterium]